MRSRPGLRVGVTLGPDQTATAAGARWAEAAGFDVLATGEHLFFHGPVANAFVSLAAAAGATTRIRLLSSLTVAPLYPAAVLAKLATSLDQVSGGRFDLGVGVGGEFPPEFVAAGIDPRTRGDRTEETLDILAALWAGGPVIHEGRFTRIPSLTIEPGPVQPGGPPVWMGGRRPAAIRRAGRYADVWLPYLFTPAQLSNSLAQVRDEAERHGRDPEAVRGAIYCWGAVHPDADTARRLVIDEVSALYRQDFSSLADRYLLHGGPARISERMLEYHEAGADTVIFAPVGFGTLRHEMAQLFATAVLPAVRLDQAP